MIPKYPDSMEWFLIDRHFSKQWSDHDNAPHSTCKEQDLLFQMACFQGCTDHVVLLPRTQVDTYQNNTHLNKHTLVSSCHDLLCVCVCVCVCVCDLLCVCVCVCVCV